MTSNILKAILEVVKLLDDMDVPQVGRVVTFRATHDVLYALRSLPNYHEGYIFGVKINALTQCTCPNCQEWHNACDT